MAKLISLEGATITVPKGWNAPSRYGDFDITCYLNNDSIGYSHFSIGYRGVFDGINFGISPSSNTICIHIEYPPFEDLSNNNSFTILLGEGDDSNNPDLIQWFIDNDATIEGGVWEETNIQITTKESIVLEMAGTKCEQDIEIIVEQEEVPVWDGTVEDYVNEKIIYVYDVFGTNTFAFNVGNASTYGDITFPCYEVDGSQYLKTASNGGLGIYLYGPQANDNVYHIYTGTLSDEVEFTDSIKNGVTLYCTGEHTGGSND